jgi:hypothetical protein
MEDTTLGVHNITNRSPPSTKACAGVCHYGGPISADLDKNGQLQKRPTLARCYSVQLDLDSGRARDCFRINVLGARLDQLMAESRLHLVIEYVWEGQRHPKRAEREACSASPGSKTHIPCTYQCLFRCCPLSSDWWEVSLGSDTEWWRGWTEADRQSGIELASGPNVPIISNQRSNVFRSASVTSV